MLPRSDTPKIPLLFKLLNLVQEDSLSADFLAELIMKHLNPNIVDENDNNALLYALKLPTFYPDLIFVLIEKTHHINQKNKAGETALSLIFNFNFKHQREKKINLIFKLLERGIQFDLDSISNEKIIQESLLNVLYGSKNEYEHLSKLLALHPDFFMKNYLIGNFKIERLDLLKDNFFFLFSLHPRHPEYPKHILSNGISRMIAQILWSNAYNQFWHANPENDDKKILNQFKAFLAIDIHSDEHFSRIVEFIYCSLENHKKLCESIKVNETILFPSKVNAVISDHLLQVEYFLNYSVTDKPQLLYSIKLIIQKQNFLYHLFDAALSAINHGANFSYSYHKNIFPLLSLKYPFIKNYFEEHLGNKKITEVDPYDIFPLIDINDIRYELQRSHHEANEKPNKETIITNKETMTNFFSFLFILADYLLHQKKLNATVETNDFNQLPFDIILYIVQFFDFDQMNKDSKHGITLAQYAITHPKDFLLNAKHGFFVHTKTDKNLNFSQQVCFFRPAKRLRHDSLKHQAEILANPDKLKRYESEAKIALQHDLAKYQPGDIKKFIFLDKLSGHFLFNEKIITDEKQKLIEEQKRLNYERFYPAKKH